MGKKSSKAPDVAGAAGAEGQFSRDVARDTTYADRPDQYNPMGSLTWQQERVRDPGTGAWTTKWSQRQNMSSDMQDIYNSQMSRNKGMAALSGGMMGRIEQEMGAPADWDQFGGVQGLEYNPDELRQRAEDNAYSRETMRLDPQFQQRAEALEIKLRNQGLRPGDQAYDASMGSFGNERTDAYERARLGATSTGMAEAGQLFDQQMGSTALTNQLRQQQIDEYLGKRQFSLGESQALDPTQNVTDMSGMFSGGQA